MSTSEYVPVERDAPVPAPTTGTSGGGEPAGPPPVRAAAPSPAHPSPVSDQIDQLIKWVIDQWRAEWAEHVRSPHPDYIAGLVVEAVTNTNLISFAVETIRQRVANQLEAS